jgi:hypothetical protein
MKKEDSQLYEDLPLILTSYEEIFSEFDPRPYPKKALSEEFIHECKKAAFDKNKINLQLFIPKDKRDLKSETKIKRRLKEHFKKHTRIQKKRIFNLELKGLFWFIFGSVMMVICALFLDYKGPFWFNVVITIASPAGWFFMWEGLGKMLIKAKDLKPDYIFNKKMANAEIVFATIK